MSTDFEAGPAQITRYAGEHGAARYQVAAPGSERSGEAYLDLSADEFAHLAQAVAAATGKTHRGVEIRATLLNLSPNGLILQVNSDVLHHLSTISAARARPHDSEWAQLLPPILDADNKPFLLIEHRAVMLRDEWPEGS